MFLLILIAREFFLVHSDVPLFPLLDLRTQHAHEEYIEETAFERELRLAVLECFEILSQAKFRKYYKL